MPRILAFAGSARRESWNKKLLALAAARARQAGGEVTLVDLADYPMPLYDGDLEAAESLPENARKLQVLIAEHDGLLLACPEYNGSMTPLLKNAIDWTSRPFEDFNLTKVYGGKVAALVSASPGGLGGLRGLRHVREILAGIGVVVMPYETAVGSVHKAISADGELQDDKLKARLASAMSSLVEAVSGLHS